MSGPKPAAKGEGAVIECVVCKGRGYTIEQPWTGPMYPRECNGCHGKGTQKIRPVRS